jgi:hypothetical protein
VSATRDLGRRIRPDPEDEIPTAIRRPRSATFALSAFPARDAVGVSISRFASVAAAGAAEVTES